MKTEHKPNNWEYRINHTHDYYYIERKNVYGGWVLDEDAFDWQTLERATEEIKKLKKGTTYYYPEP